MRKLVGAIALLSVLGACASSAPPSPRPVAAAPQSKALRVPLTASRGGTPVVDVAIGGVCCAKFVVDSGASDVSVSPLIFGAMVKGGYLTKADMIDVVNYRTANGVSKGLRFRMPPLTVGGHTVYGVIGSASPDSDMMLLGQSFLTKFRFWAIDNNNGALVLGTMTKISTIALLALLAVCAAPSNGALSNASGFPNGGGPQGPSGGAVATDRELWSPPSNPPSSIAGRPRSYYTGSDWTY